MYAVTFPLVGRVGAPLVRREVETSLLTAALRDAADGPVLVLLSGEAGVGKSRLLDETTGEAAALGWRILTGHCLRLTGPVLPYAPWTEVLRSLVRSVGRARMAELLGDDADSLAPALPLSVAGPVPPAGHVLEALLVLVERLAAERPLLLGLEDLHWADPASLDALTFLVRNLDELPVLMVATTRSDESLEPPVGAALAELRRAARTRPVDLAPLPPDATAALAVALGADPATAASLHARTGGNPYYVQELVAAGSAPVSSLRDVVLARLEGLPASARRVLEALSVIDRPTTAPLLAQATGLTPGQVDEGLHALGSRRLLGTTEAGHTPPHALAAEAVLAHLLPGTRAALHTAYADAIEQEPAALGDPAGLRVTVAEHRSGGSDRRALLRAAAAVVLEGRSSDAVLKWGDVALDTWPLVADPDVVAGCTRGELLARTGEAALRSGRVSRAVELLQASLREDDAADASVAGLREERLAMCLWQAGRGTEADEANDRALELIGPAPSTALARAQAGSASTLMVLGRWESAEQRCREGIATAEHVGAVDEQAHLLGTLGVVLVCQGRDDEGLAELERARGLARAGGDVRLQWRTLVNAAYAQYRAARLAEAAQTSLEALDLVRRHGLELSAERAALSNAVSPLIELGRWDEVDALLADAPGGADDDPRARLLARAAAALAVARGQDVDDALLAGDEDEPAVRQQRDQVLADRALWAGDPEGALAAVDDGLAAGGALLDRTRLAATGLRAVADRLVLPAGAGGPGPDERERLRRKADELAGLLDAGGSAEQQALRRQGLAEQARAAGADDTEAWDEVARAWQEQHRPYPAAVARWRLADAARRARDPRAAQWLREAHALASSLGAAPLCRELELLAVRTRTSLASAQAVPAQPGPLDGLALTPREQQALTLLSTGASNRRIARELSISESTAGVHVSNVLRKLGVANRAEATAVAHRLGLVPVERKTS